MEKNSIDKEKKQQEKEIKKLHRQVERTEEQLKNYERIVDRTQHLLNTRIEEVEAAKAELMARTKELELSEDRFRQLADAAFETIIIHSDGVIIDSNDAAVELYGISKGQLVGKNIHELIESGQDNTGKDWTQNAFDKPVEDIHIGVDGKVPVEVRSRAIELKGGSALVTAIRDISAHKKIEDYLKKVANSDVLTEVGNRRFFLEEGKKEYSRASRYGQPLSLLMLDIDKFKNINDTYGHDVGDVALKALARVCEETLRESDIFARLGGEEFAAILPGTEIEGAAQLAERLRANIQAMVTTTSKGDILFTASMGVTQMRPELESEDIEIMLNRSDKGLYEAKETGRNKVVIS